MNLIRFFITTYTVVFICLFEFSCDGNSSNSSKKAPLPRIGKDIQPYSIKNYDGSPSMSKDGNRIVFVTGKDKSSSDSDFSTDSLKIHKIDLGLSETNSSAAVGSESYISQINALISPDGMWILIESKTENETVILLQSFEENEKTFEVQRGSFSESSFSWSDDSTFFAIATRNDENSSSLFIGKIPDSSETSFPADKLSTNLCSENFEINPIFMLDSSNGFYSLITSTTGTDNTNTLFLKRKFSSLSDLGSVTPENWLEGLYSSSRDTFSLNQTSLFLSKKDFPLGSVTYPVEDKKISAKESGISDKKYSVKTEPVLIQTSDVSSVQTISTDKLIGSEVLSTSLTSDSSVVLHAVKSYIKCNKDFLYVTGMVFVDSSFSSQKLLIPMLLEDKQWSLSEDPCCRGETLDSSAGTPDYAVTKSQVNTSGSLSSGYSILYITSRTGDPEIMYFKVNSSGIAVFTEISNNPM